MKIAPLIANARMYAINPAVAAAWRALLEWVAARAEVPLDVIDYPAPAPLPALWSRTDAACVFMCGYPLSLAQPQPRVLAAPVPSPPSYAGRPEYWTDIIVRTDSKIARLEDTFGKRFAFTTADSQSGYQAPRLLFARHAHGAHLFAATVGPLVTPRRVVDAIIEGDADAGPLDSYVHALLRYHEPEVASRWRVVTATPPTPIPPLVAAPGLPDGTVQRITGALLAVATAAALEAIRATLQLQGFVPAAADDYRVLRTGAQQADNLGYPRLA
ncbi:MAG: PhnD/SsuA/transferrin family substrate-binding protein [Casimicrobiaceae bacterium]